METMLEHQPNPSSPRRRRGQALAEFALTLPILLLMLFGIIEFARIFQAWVTLQNAARTAARYAITGQFNPDDLEAIADTFALNEGDAAAAADPNTRINMCTEGDHRGLQAIAYGQYTPVGAGDYENIFANHWDGLDCEPGKEEHQGLVNDLARIQSIRDQARVGAAGLDIRMWDEEAYAMEGDPSEGTFVRWQNDDQPGWFHVFVCSSRPTLRDEDEPDVERYNRNYDDLLCTVQEWRGTPPSNPDGTTPPNPYTDPAESVDNNGALQWDAGGPGDAVDIIVTFNHPLITPLPLPAYVTLQARRTMINEAFRTSRVVNLPPVLALPTEEPSVTFTASMTSTASETPEATFTHTPTHTPTQTGTPTATSTPDCTLISITNVSFSGSYLQASIRNDNPSPLDLEGVRLEWSKHALYPNMYTDRMVWNTRTFWDGTDATPPTIANKYPSSETEPTWNSATSTQLGANSTGVWQARFGNGPSNLSTYYNQPDFTGTTWYFSNGCMLQIDDDAPTPNPEDPTETPPPDCGDYRMNFEAFWPHGVVQFNVLNTGGTPIQITGIDVSWVYYFNGMNLNFIQIGGSNAFDPVGVRVWEGDDTGTTLGEITHTLTGSLGTEPTWLINATINPGDSAYLWLDFDATSDSLDDRGAHDYDFNGITLAFDNGCEVQPRPIASPVPAICGDGSRNQSSEQCDDGNTNNNDSCKNDCTYQCGDNSVNSAAGETCDDGNRNNNDGCSSTCQLEICGDGIRQSGEECDEGSNNGSSSSTCDSSCQLKCGNGTVDSGEQCDDGNSVNTDQCNNSCQRTYCGNGYKDNDPYNSDGFKEECDHGSRNGRPGDSCSVNCTLVEPVCGNGYREDGEQCDDGNTSNGDGCSSTCQVEPRCGDGSVNQPSEQCDPPNGSTCSSSCQIIDTGPVCGNGSVESGEECDPPNGTTCSSSCQIIICADCG